MAFNFDKLKISPTLTIRFKFPLTTGPGDKPVTFLVKPADANVNAAYAARLTAASARWAPIPSDLNDDATRILNMQRTAEVYHKAVVVGWEEVYDAEGKPTPLTLDSLRDFLVALGTSAPDIAGRFVAYTQRAQNFREVEPELIAKN